MTGVQGRRGADEVGGGEHDAVRRHGQAGQVVGREVPRARPTLPARIAAVAWASASQPLRAMTVTAARSVSDIAPETGSTTWWRMAPSWIQRRERVLDVATPPALTVIVTRSAFGSSGCSTVTAQPAGTGGVPAQARSPPTSTSAPPAPAAQQLGDDEIGGQSLADAARVQGDARRRRHGSPFGVDGDRGETADVLAPSLAGW